MKFIPTRVHGYMDYIVSALLIASPWIFNFNRGGAETYVPVFVGALGILISLFTDYEVALFRKIPMVTHLSMDVISGVFLALSPWLFGFNAFVYKPHLFFGIFEIAAGFCTYLVPEFCPPGAPCSRVDRRRKLSHI